MSQNVNVFTHYTHKLAFEADQRQEKRSNRRPWRIPAAVKVALFCGLAVALLTRHQPEMPIFTSLAAFWGGAVTWLVFKFRERLRKVAGALRGRPLEDDDLRSFGARRPR